MFSHLACPKWFDHHKCLRCIHQWINKLIQINKDKNSVVVSATCMFLFLIFLVSSFVYYLSQTSTYKQAHTSTWHEPESKWNQTIFVQDEVSCTKVNKFSKWHSWSVVGIHNFINSANTTWHITSHHIQALFETLTIIQKGDTNMQWNDKSNTFLHIELLYSILSTYMSIRDQKLISTHLLLQTHLLFIEKTSQKLENPIILVLHSRE